MGLTPSKYMMEINGPNNSSKSFEMDAIGLNKLQSYIERTNIGSNQPDQTEFSFSFMSLIFGFNQSYGQKKDYNIMVVNSYGDLIIGFPKKMTCEEKDCLFSWLDHQQLHITRLHNLLYATKRLTVSVQCNGCTKKSAGSDRCLRMTYNLSRCCNNHIDYPKFSVKANIASTVRKPSFTSSESSRTVNNSNRCKGIANSTGERCKNTVKDGETYCASHKNDSLTSFGTVSMKSVESVMSTSSKKSATSSRCSGITKKGVRCNNTTTSVDGYCHVHKN